MNQIKIGIFIQKKRKERNLTQEQLAEKLGVSNKTVSKWECGKAIPDYSLVENLCKILKISTADLFNGEESSQFNETQMLEMLKRLQFLENQKNLIIGLFLIGSGLTCYCISHFFGGSTVKDFISGVFSGLSIFEILIGTYVSISATVKNK